VQRGRLAEKKSASQSAQSGSPAAREHTTHDRLEKRARFLPTNESISMRRRA
jgi:hypothetical protein